MSFLSVLGKIAKVGEALAPTVATAINPAAGALTSLVVNAVTQAEQAGGTGAQKKAAAMQSVLPAAAGIVNAALQSTGTTVNSTQLSSAVSSMIDGTVSLLNSVQTSSASSTAASAAAPSSATATGGSAGS